MKKIVLFILLAGFLTTANAQKTSSKVKRAKAETEYVTSKMSLDKEKSAFLQEVLVEKYTSASEQIHAKEVSKEEKKAIRKSVNKEANSKLAEQFSKAEIKEINGFLKEYNIDKKK